MAEAARKTTMPVRDEAPESPRPQPVGLVTPGEKRAKTRTPAADKVRQIRRRDRIRWALFALLPLALIVGVYLYITGGQVMSTDDAHVQAEEVGISTDVSGIVQDIAVKDNQHVAAGQAFTICRATSGRASASRWLQSGDAKYPGQSRRHRSARYPGQSRFRGSNDCACLESADGCRPRSTRRHHHAANANHLLYRRL
jgi:membrane fusion protein, multidrug efflux system